MYVYTLSDPRNNRVRYVGITNNIKTRLNAHISESKNIKQSSHKIYWIRDLLRNNLKPILQVIHKCSEETIDYWEQFWILFYRCIYSDLTNMHDGGKYQKLSDETKLKISLSRKGRKFPNLSLAKRGEKRSEEHKQKIANSMIGEKNHFFGKSHSIESKQKIGAVHKGKTISEENKNLYSFTSRVKRKDSSSQYHGVSKTYNGKWRCRISFKKKTVYHATFDNELDAARAYDREIIKYISDAILNDIA